MKEDFYNSNEKKFEKLISLLKELPQDKVPGDFEFKLMTRIHNGNFKLNEPQRNKWWTFWIIVPAFTLTAAVVILFFVFNSTVTYDDNPLLAEPQLRQDVIASKNNSINFKEFKNKKTADAKSEYSAVLKANDVVVNRKVKLPFSTNNSINLDSYLNNKKSLNNIITPGRLVEANEEYFNFDGFFSAIPSDGKTLEKLRAKIDSIRKTELTNQNK